MSQDEERFLEKVEFIPFSTCWHWKAAKFHNGYGSFRHKNGQLAHRFSFEHWNGKIDENKHIDHICKNRGCVNPSHLRQVTPTQNALYNSDGITAKNKAKTHCKQGHEFTGHNLIIRKDGYRDCRACKYARTKTRRIKIKLKR